MATTPARLATVIRYHLGELRARNGHHEFECLARHLTRARIYSNVLPATGPVSAGGDGGRDFETFRTQMHWPVTAGATFAQMSSQGRSVAFACSLESAKRIETKIRSDVDSIIDSGPVDEVVYFCEANLPVAKRHKLQGFATARSVVLQVFDGTAIAEMLADRDTFWIAEEYLRIPSELMPRSSNDPEWYVELRTRWTDRHPIPISQSDFIEVKSALRRATFHPDNRADLSMWLAKMAGFLSTEAPRHLQRCACYEVTVASFRGKGDMTASAGYLADYYSDFESFLGLADLQDAATLLVYSWGAHALTAFDVDGEILLARRERLVRVIEQQIGEARGPGRRSGLLQVRGYLGFVPLSRGAPSDPDESARYWSLMLDEAANAPLFPIESFADFFAKAIEHGGDLPALVELGARIDELVARRAGDAAAGEHALERASTYLEHGHDLWAMRELHRVKLRWFTGEKLVGGLRAILLLSECYRKLGLAYAAKYYALAAAYIARYEQDDEIAQLLPRALFMAVDAEDAAGNALGFMHLFLFALEAHLKLEPDPLDNEKHPRLQENLGQLAGLFGLLGRGEPTLRARLDPALALLPPPFRQEVVRAAEDPRGFWNQGTWDEAWSVLEATLIDRPWGDFATVREVRWRALGIEWLCRFANTYAVVPAAEQFIAEWQLALCGLATIDLCLAPTSVVLEVSLNKRLRRLRIEPLGEIEGKSVFRVQLPVVDRDHNGVRDAFSAVSVVLRCCSVLPDNRYLEVVRPVAKSAAEQIHIMRPYAELFREFLPEDGFFESVRAQSDGFRRDMPFAVKESDELGWIDAPGPTYEAVEAKQAIALRYERCMRCIPRTARRISKSPAHALLSSLHLRGLRDWHILSILLNIAVNARLDMDVVQNLDGAATDAMVQATVEMPESDDIALNPAAVTVELIETYEAVFMDRLLAFWKLERPAGPLRKDAIERFLAVRYRIYEDDVEHEDVFGWGD